MLWLAGLMGLVGVGAASFAVVQIQQDDDEDDAPPDTGELENNGNLLEQLGMVSDDDPMEDPQWADDDDDDILYNDILTARGFGPASYDTADDDAAWADDDLIDLLDPAQPPLPLTGFEAPLPFAALTGDWISQGDPQESFDYDSDTEQLVLVWDDMADGAEEPQVAVNPHPQDIDAMQITMNGAPVAEVAGVPDLSVAHLAVIPLSSALIAGLAPIASKHAAKAPRRR